MIEALNFTRLQEEVRDRYEYNEPVSYTHLVNDDTENLIDDLKEYKITADTKFTAIYEKDTEIIGSIYSVSFS